MSSKPPEEETIRIAMIASAVVDELSRRYSMSPGDVQTAVRWVQEHREFVSKLKHAGYLSMIGTLVGATLLIAWEGVKAYIRKVTE